MTAVHMAAITEAMAFCQFLDVDVELMYDIVVNAAGNSKVFGEFFEGMRGKGWRVEGVERGGEVVGRLVSLIFFPLVGLSLSRALSLSLSRARSCSFPVRHLKKGGKEGDGSSEHN